MELDIPNSHIKYYNPLAKLDSVRLRSFKMVKADKWLKEIEEELKIAKKDKKFLKELLS